MTMPTRPSSTRMPPSRRGNTSIPLCIAFAVFGTITLILFHPLAQPPPPPSPQHPLQTISSQPQEIQFLVNDKFSQPSPNRTKLRPRTKQQTTCNYQKLTDLPPSELHPQNTTQRHIIQPPLDQNHSQATTTLVCCKTTAGPLSILTHSSWAPNGVRRFLGMVRTKYFSTQVPFFRCIPNFICQFGIAGNPKFDHRYKHSKINDDPNWLPEGPTHRTNHHGVKRFAKGYLAYAGSGPNSRTNQFIVALQDQPRLGGGSPWEVPWGEVVGEDSFETLDSIYTGYGDEKGPSQGRLHEEGWTVKLKKEFVSMDYILSCGILDSETY